MPASLFEGSTEDEVKAIAVEGGFTGYTMNADGSVTYTMTKAKHEATLAELRDSMEEAIDGMLTGSEAIASFRSIKHSEDFSRFDVYIDMETFNVYDGMNIIAFYIYGAYYQAFEGKAEEDIDVLVSFINNATGETLDSTSYRELMEDLGATG